MKRRSHLNALISATLIAGFALSACGIRGELKTPPPVWGDDNRTAEQKAIAEDVALREIADNVGTPCYIYSTATFERHYTVFADSFKGIDALVAYSVKANSNIGILATLAKLGAGADVVSGGELQRALTAGIPGHKIVFSGVGKTASEMRAALVAGIRVFNVDVHIGSQIDDLAPFEKAISKVGELIARLRANGHTIRSFDIGGGLGIPYGDNSITPPPPDQYGAMVKRLTALYDAYHEIEPVMAPGGAYEEITYDVVGPICESGDTFTKARDLPEMSAGDLLVMHSAGAYGASLSNQYRTTSRKINATAELAAL